ncbi:phospho-acceptor domain-containing protein [Mucilaginibacter frigoritolerans]|jgi:signal transduction histidine kinase|uniref:histidine kinase n=1 Tax=Mucilaginibacter frigoritolerans TaxID=652788 RepID=A0A562UFR8_9SPHI|nr:HAMP domain-containing sensor histidine kinase [Mucilaginibacter frigoritolerans]TWJ04676.1 phospho-acceptor domain-containing protein [Mucilaginibacter frigoritolerans]
MDTRNLADQLIIANQDKVKLASELSIANAELDFQNKEKGKRAAELLLANIELDFQNNQKLELARELVIANKELDFQNEEKAKRAAELIIANKELLFQNSEKEKRAAELVIAYTQLDLQNREREKRAAELILANTELIFQNKEKEKRAAELAVANTELLFQNEEKEKRAAELIIANTELVFQNLEKEKRANELIIANKELVFQNHEKGKRAAELIIANIELDFQDEEKEKRAAELIVALKELDFQDEEKSKRAAELLIANREVLIQKQEKVRRAAAEAKKDEFFNMVSHEFKTPLTNIKAINQLLQQRTDCTDKIYPFIVNANHNIKRLEKLIEDLLDVTKINSGQIDLNIAAFYFSDALTNSIVNVQLTAHQHEILLESSVEQLYSGDQFRIEQVLINLLNNAIKYSPNATQVLVKAKIDVGNIVVSVVDFGIGIAKEDINQLFQRFYRVSKTAMNFQGVGLGLYIASEIIKKHNGSFSIESEPGKGSSFHFSLPLNQTG